MPDNISNALKSFAAGTGKEYTVGFAQPQSGEFWGDVIGEISNSMLSTAARTARYALTLGNQDPTITTTLERWAIEEPEKRSQEFRRKYAQEGMWTKSWAESAPSIGYGLTTIGPALGAGAVTSVLGAPGLASWTGSAVAGYVAYAATREQKLDELFREANEASKQQRSGQALNKQEWDKIAKNNDYINKARAYGLYEAIPEAITLAMGWKILRVGVGALPVIGKPLAVGATKVVGKVAAKALSKTAPLPLRMAGRVAALQAPEHIQEAYTGYQQHRIDQELHPESTAGEPDYSAVGPFKMIPTSLGLLAETAIEQAPTVAITTGVLGGLGAGASAIMRGTKSKKSVNIFTQDEIQKIPHNDPMIAQKEYELTLNELQNNTRTIEDIENSVIASYESAGYPEYIDSIRRAIDDYKAGIGLAQEQEAFAEVLSPELQARKDAIEQQLTEEERVRQSTVGTEGLRQQLTKEEALTGAETTAFEEEQEGIIRETEAEVSEIEARRAEVEKELTAERGEEISPETYRIYQEDNLSTGEKEAGEIFGEMLDDFRFGIINIGHVERISEMFREQGQENFADRVDAIIEEEVGFVGTPEIETVPVEQRPIFGTELAEAIEFGERAEAIGTQLTEEERLRRSQEGAEGLAEQLTEEERIPPKEGEEGVIPVEPTEPPVTPIEPTEVTPPVEEAVKPVVEVPEIPESIEDNIERQPINQTVIPSNIIDKWMPNLASLIGVKGKGRWGDIGIKIGRFNNTSKAFARNVFNEKGLGYDSVSEAYQEIAEPVTAEEARRGGVELKDADQIHEDAMFEIQEWLNGKYVQLKNKTWQKLGEREQFTQAELAEMEKQEKEVSKEEFFTVVDELAEEEHKVAPITEQEFNDRGEGHTKFLGYINSLIKDKTVLPEHKDLFMEIFKDTDDGFLNTLKIKAEARLRRSGYTTVLPWFGPQQNIKIKRFLAKLNREASEEVGEDPYYSRPNIEASITFLHEYGHVGYWTLLTPAEQQLVKEIYKNTGKEQLKKYFNDIYGISPASKYYAKNEREFFSETFAGYALTKKAPSKQLTKLFDKVLNHLKQAITRIREIAFPGRIENLEPLFDKILTGTRGEITDAPKESTAGIPPITEGMPSPQSVTPEEADQFINNIRSASIIEKQKATDQQDQTIITEKEKMDIEQRNYEGVVGDVLKFAQAIRDTKDRGGFKKKDLTWVEKILSLPAFFFEKFPATQRGMGAVFREPHNRANIFHKIIGKVMGVKNDLVTPINDLMKKSKIQYNKLQKLIWDNDINQTETGFVYMLVDRDGKRGETVHSIEEADKIIREHAYHREKDEISYDIYDMFDEKQRKIGNVKTLEEAEKAGLYKQVGRAGYKVLDENRKQIAHVETLEQAEFLKSYYSWTYDSIINLDELGELGFTRKAAEAFSNLRKIIQNSFDAMLGRVNEKIRDRERNGLKAEERIELDNGETVTINLYELYSSIKKARNSFMPRVRGKGDFWLWADKREHADNTFDNREDADAYIAEMEEDGYIVDKKDYDEEADVYKVNVLKNLDNPWSKNFGSKIKRTVFARELEAQGYTVREYFKTQVSPNSLGLADSVINIENQMRATMDRMGTLMKKDPDVQTQEQLMDLQTEFEDLMLLSLSETIKGGGYRSHTIARRKDKGVNVVKGFEEDLLKAMDTYTHSISFGLSRSQMLEEMIRAMQGTDIVDRAEFVKKDKDGEPILDEKGKPVIDTKAYLKALDKERIDPNEQKVLYKTWTQYMQDQLRPNDKLDNAVGFLKSIIFMKFLAANVSSPLVNSTAVVTSNVGVMNGELGIPFSSAVKLQGQALNKYYRQWKNNRQKRLSKGTVDFFTQIDNEAWAEAQLTSREAFSVLNAGLDSWWKKLLRVTMVPFAISEKMTRIGAMVGSYLHLEQQAIDSKLTPEELKKIGFTDEQIEQMGDLKRINYVGPLDANGNPTTKEGIASEFARGAFRNRSLAVSRKSLGEFGKASRAYITWGEGIGPSIAQLGLTFTTYPHTYLNSTYGYFRAGKEKRKAMLYMLAAPMVLAGVPAFPLAMQGVPVLSQLTHTILKKVLDSDEPERDFYRWLNDISPNLESFARKGVIGSFGVDISGSLEFQMPSIKNNVVTSLYEDLLESKEYWDQGDIGRIAETLIPSRLITSLLKTRRETVEGITSRIGRPAFFGKEQMRLTPFEIGLQSLGLRPSRISAEKETMWLDTKVEREYKKRRDTIYTRYRKYFLKPADKRKSSELDEIKRMIIDYNRRLRQKKRVDVTFPATIGPIEPGDLRRNLSMTLKPSRRERLRKKKE